MIDVKVNQEEVKEIYLDELKKAIEEAEKEAIFWDTKELVRQTKFSLSTIQKTFFDEEGFAKYKLGGKWMF
ncbi:hypothetical protein [Rossellomorea marisflavi]|uniref:hypothetical protein n=1 Tax=Rossellomorea marisflavi TaxID=189381 RepID=UPI001EE27DEB|nr:hypothetical protein [Rossellomorea marisflavi]